MISDGLSDLLACVAAFGRSLGETFAPAQFLAEFSTRVQRLVPHDYIVIVRREGSRATCSVFAEYAMRGALPAHGGQYTTAFTRGERLPVDTSMAPLFAGETQLIGDVTTDTRFGHDALVANRASGLRALVGAPLYAAGNVTGALRLVSATPHVYTDAHVAACRQIADLIGPFVETVVTLHRERRRRERLEAVTALPAILGASLKLGDVLDRLGEAVRPLIDFNVMGLWLASADGQGFDLAGFIGSGGVSHGPPDTASATEHSLVERVSRGENLVIGDAERELDLGRAGDRDLLQSGHRSLLGVPLLFGEVVGAVSFSGHCISTGTTTATSKSPAPSPRRSCSRCSTSVSPSSGRRRGASSVRSRPCTARWTIGSASTRSSAGRQPSSRR